MTQLEDLTETWPSNLVPEIDRPGTHPDTLTGIQRHWRDHGWAVLPDRVPEHLLSDYEDEWLRHHGPPTYDAPYRHPGGWDYVTAHRDHPALARLVTCPEIGDYLEVLLGEAAGVHLTLTGWVTTTRDWHQDCYLNPPGVGGYYAAVWIALNNIDPDSGPFQFVDRSHLWEPLSQDKVRAELGPAAHGHDWPRRSEELLSPLFEQRIHDDHLKVVDHLPKRGEVLVWHSRLLHRGARARLPGTERRALIAHYSGIRHRPDMPAAQHVGDGWMFPVDDRAGLPAEQLTGGVR